MTNRTVQENFFSACTPQIGDLRIDHSNSLYLVLYADHMKRQMGIVFLEDPSFVAVRGFDFIYPFNRMTLVSRAP